ncbi:cellulase family glycosylhydrolase [Aquimarina sp. MMG015]|uniref:cellulase family glycosylhydrolase n=1 Tax=Aquimarina sp. MMG015 TaxID=2822689 RepID=UPI001B3A60D6|nr:cellulase family glycosylhydrolase [Aquimarina sp. MMG015]MBQ4801857.1 cellulase family glycosylhydrolase [Aquimarina sp. MMG015]
MKTQCITSKYRILIQIFIWTTIFGLKTLAQQSPVEQNGQLKVCGTKLCNQYNKPIQLRGMSTHGIQWYGWGNCLTESSLDALAYDWDADILRISLYVQEGGYETDPVGFTNQVNRLIDEATERGMYALVDWHQLNPGDPNANLENAKRFFIDIANQHKDKNNIIYDVCNEPNGSGVTWNRIKTYADQIIPVIKAIDNNAVVLVGTQGWATFGVSGEGTLQDVINNPLQFDNVMYTFHFYANSHRDAYLSTLDQASNQLPVFVTEFGSQEFTGDGPNDFAMTQQFIDLMRQKKISWTSWNYSDDIRSGASWKSGTCSSGVWTSGNLKPAGSWIRDKIKNPADDFPGDDNGGDNQSPYEGMVWSIPGKIEAENYDLGGQNIAYNEVSISNEGGSYRNDAVDIEPCSEGGFNIGWVKSNEWLEYTVDVENTGDYEVAFRVAAITSGRQFHLKVNNENISGAITVPNTGGWQNWQTVSANVSLNKGKQVIRLVMDSDDLNINHMIFDDQSGIPNQSPVCSITSPFNDQEFEEGDSATINADVSDSDGVISKVEFYNGTTKIGEDTSLPYQHTISNVSSQISYVLMAKAFDNGGASTDSAPVRIVVSGDVDNNCDASQYVDGTNYQTGDVVQNFDKKYECLVGGWCSIGGPYTPGGTEDWAWPNAWKELGACTGGDENQKPTVSIAQPLQGSLFQVNETIVITANAEDRDGSISKVEFFINGTKIAEDTVVPFTTNWIGVEGNQTITAKVTDNQGDSSEASAVSITVGSDIPPPPSGLPARILNGYWHNFQNGSGLIRLKDVSSDWDVINVSFAVSRVSPTDGEIEFQLDPIFSSINYTIENFKSDIQFLQSQGKKVIISIGGAEGQVRLNTTSARDKFVTSMISIIEEYNFDGMDIDFEGQSLSFDFGDTDFKNPTTPVIVNTIDAIQNVCNHFGNNFILTMAPETFFVQLGYSFYGGISQGADRRAGAYLPLIYALRDKLTFLQVQYYNSGSITALDNRFYSMGNADFYVSLVDMLLKGFPITGDQSKFFPALRPDQILIGVPATVNAGNGYTGSQGVINALDYIIKGNSFGGQYDLSQTYPQLRGVMSWSINWDQFGSFAFSDPVREYLDGLQQRDPEQELLEKESLKMYPNPFSSEVTITFKLGKDKLVNAVIYNQIGVKIAVLKDNERLSFGSQNIQWDTDGIPSGIYFLKLRIGKEVKTMKLIKQ